ncbi:MAG: translation initiation factor Sui1 [Spongiibacteraceae bacterium]
MGLVYSTEKGRICPRCNHPVDECQCSALRAQSVMGCSEDGIVRIKRQTQGRGGKVVTTISGIALPAEEVKQLAKKLKQACGSGGTVSDGIIEIQGDHRDKLKTELEKLGHTVKLAGG